MKDTRSKMGISVTAMSYLLGVRRSQYSMFELNKRQLPDASTKLNHAIAEWMGKVHRDDKGKELRLHQQGVRKAAKKIIFETAEKASKDASLRKKLGAMEIAYQQLMRTHHGFQQMIDNHPLDEITKIRFQAVQMETRVAIEKSGPVAQALLRYRITIGEAQAAAAAVLEQSLATFVQAQEDMER